jgi:hypothetical protein
LSFFDDEETATRTTARASRPAQHSQPRRPQGAGRSLPVDRHTLMVRRRVALGVGVVLLIIIVVWISSCLKSQKTQALKDYNQRVGTLARQYDENVGRPLFSTLAGATGKSALNVGVGVNGLREQAKELASQAKGLSTPGEMAAAQRNLVLAFDLRSEGLAKIAALLPSALGGQNKQAATKLAGDMEILLASDVIYSQRVAPLIQQALSDDGIHEVPTAGSRALPNLGWLEPTTLLARLGGQSGTSSSSSFTPGNHGSALRGVTVAAHALEAEPAINHISGGGNPTFTLQVENSGEFPETDVKADVTVTAGGKQFKASHLIEKTEPGKTVSVDIPLAGVPQGVAAKIEANIEGVRGENDVENNKGTFLAIFGK